MSSSLRVSSAADWFVVCQLYHPVKGVPGIPPKELLKQVRGRAADPRTARASFAPSAPQVLLCLLASRNDTAKINALAFIQQHADTMLAAEGR